MAKGIGESGARNLPSFWELPEDAQQKAEDDAVKAAGVNEWWDLDPEVRRRVRDQAILNWSRGLRWQP